MHREGVVGVGIVVAKQLAERLRVWSSVLCGWVVWLGGVAGLCSWSVWLVDFTVCG